MSKINIVGIDPAIRNTGLAFGQYDTETEKLEIKRIALVTTEKEKSKQVRRNSDDLRRARAIIHGIKSLGGLEEDVHLYMAEIPTGSQSARSSFSNGVCVGVLAGLPSLIELTPSEVKEKAVGSKVADKSEMIEWAYQNWPDLQWSFYRGKLQNKNEHMADACGVLNAGVQSQEFRNIVKALMSF